MKLCERHEEMAKQELSKRDLIRYCTSDQEQLTRKAMSFQASNGEVTWESYDPAAGTYISLVEHCVDVCGKMSLLPRNGQPKCPVCYLNERHKGECQDPERCEANAEELIPSAAERQLEVLRALQQQPRNPNIQSPSPTASGPVPDWWEKLKQA